MVCMSRDQAHHIPTTPLGRVPSLDGMRGLAALAVLAYHTRLPGFASGSLGVDVFFVLSGFLITGLMLAELRKSGALDYGRFESRRFMRLFPAMLVMLVVFWFAAPALFPNVDRNLEFILSAGYVSNWARIVAAEPIVTQHTWSLAVEMQFYLVWPVIFAGLYLLFRDRISLAVVVMLLIFCAWRFWLQYSGQAGGGRIYSSLDGRAPSLLIGALLATTGLTVRPWLADMFGFLGAAILAACIGRLIFVGVPSAYWAPVVEVSTVALIVGALHGRVLPSLLGCKPLSTLGLWSYSIYLWHYPIARLAREALDPVPATLLTIAITIPLAAASFYLVERQFVKIGRQRSPIPA